MKGRAMIRGVLDGAKLCAGMYGVQVLAWLFTGNPLNSTLGEAEGWLSVGIVLGIVTWLCWNAWDRWLSDEAIQRAAARTVERGEERRERHALRQQRALAEARALQGHAGELREALRRAQVTSAEAESLLAFAAAVGARNYSFTPGHGLPALRYVSPPPVRVVIEERYTVPDQPGLAELPGDCVSCGLPHAYHLHYRPYGRCRFKTFFLR